VHLNGGLNSDNSGQCRLYMLQTAEASATSTADAHRTHRQHKKRKQKTARDPMSAMQTQEAVLGQPII
jgi:hypothetical protein